LRHFSYEKAVHKESKVLLGVRQINQQIAREADADPGYHQRLNGLGGKLLAPCQKKSKKMGKGANHARLGCLRELKIFILPLKLF